MAIGTLDLSIKKCSWHLCIAILRGRQSKFCSVRCKEKFFVNRKRKALKLQAVEYKGGGCALCGYAKCVDALTFHHVAEKDFGIAYKGYTRSWDKVRMELDKCVLVCGNCHSEIHAGLATIGKN